MTLKFEGPRLDRRTVLGLGAAIGVFGAAALSNSTAVQVGATVGPAVSETPLEPEPRYAFRCLTPSATAVEYSRLEEVWASPMYMRTTSCEVRYIGQGQHALTVEESAIVQIAEGAGLVTGDRAAAYLTILAACTRIAPDLEVRLAQLGVPMVTAALALAPEAPQAKRLSEWLRSVS